MLKDKHNFELVKVKIKERSTTEKNDQLKKLFSHIDKKSAILSYVLLCKC
nr:hypothetical protein [Mycoplasmopsis bovis]